MQYNHNENCRLFRALDSLYHIGNAGIQITDYQEGYDFGLNGSEILTDHCASAVDDNDYIFSAAKLKKFELAESARRSYANAIDDDIFLAAKLKQLELAGSSSRSPVADHYPMEYSDLVSLSDLEDLSMIEDGQNPIREISAVERAILPTRRGHFYSSQAAAFDDWTQNMEASSAEEMLLDRLQQKELFDYVITNREKASEKVCNQSSLQYKNLTKDYPEGFDENERDSWDADHLELSQEDHNRKRRLCRHYLKGHCKRGTSCDFLHDPSIFCPDTQKIFLGGLPDHITESTLRQKLAQLGFNVINKPKILRGFTPQVCMASLEQAQKLIQKRAIFIDGSRVDVRAYEAFAQGGINKTSPDEIKRSVFLGGLPKGTTGQMIKHCLEKIDVKVVNHPITKTGFTPKVTLSSIEESNMLIRLKKIWINDTLVDVRPYVNYNKCSLRSSKRKCKIPN